VVKLIRAERARWPVKLLDAVSLAVALAFAAPAGLLGVETLLAGDPTGWVFLAFAAGIVAFERWVVTPDDVPVVLAQKTTRAVVEEPADGPEDVDGPDGDSNTQ